jgi:hypothetical protein
MLKRTLLVVALACACSPAVAPLTGSSPSSPCDAARAVRLEPQLAGLRPRHARHVARLAPPFAASNLTRRVPDSEPMTALVTAP